jgi:hypothetical protein
MLRISQGKVESFKRHQDEEEIKEKRRTGIIKDIPSEYGVGLPMATLEEVHEFVKKLDDNVFWDETKPQPVLRSRRMELVSEIKISEMIIPTWVG